MPEENSINMINEIISQGGLAGVAALCIWVLHNWYKESIRQKERENEDHRQDKAMLITALNENSRTNAAVTEAISHFERVVMARMGSDNSEMRKHQIGGD